MKIDLGDPNEWGQELPYRPLWIDPDANLFCIVDNCDHEWALKWLWHTRKSRTGPNIYVTRNTRLEGSKGPQATIYLHKEILKRTFIMPPSVHHTIADHINGNSLDDRRCNLRWATSSENSLNRIQHREAANASR